METQMQLFMGADTATSTALQARIDAAVTRVLAGADYNHKRDRERLTTQLQRVNEICEDGNWRTVRRLCTELRRQWPKSHFPENSVQAQLRNLRKLGKTVERRRVNSVSQYRVAGWR